MCYHLFPEQLILTFASVDEILCRYHLNETSSAVPSHGTICLVRSVTIQTPLDIKYFSWS